MFLSFFKLNHMLYTTGSGVSLPLHSSFKCKPEAGQKPMSFPFGLLPSCREHLGRWLLALRFDLLASLENFFELERTAAGFLAIAFRLPCAIYSVDVRQPCGAFVRRCRPVSRKSRRKLCGGRRGFEAIQMTPFLWIGSCLDMLFLRFPL